MRTLTLLCTTCSIFFSCQTQTQPGLESPEIDSSLFDDRSVFRFTVSEDQSWLLLDILDGEGAFAIYRSEYQDSSWTDPKVVSFSGEYNDLDPFIAPDQQTVYFMSMRPLFEDDTTDDWNLWKVKITQNGFGIPEALPETINTENQEVYPTLDAAGNLYFASTRNTGLGANDLYFAAFEEGNWQSPIMLPSPINSESADSNPNINEAGDSIVYYSRRRDNNVDLYLTVKQTNNWSEPRFFNSKVNTDNIEGSGFMKDGKLYFLRGNAETRKPMGLNIIAIEEAF